jgi:hypothetical protein
MIFVQISIQQKVSLTGVSLSIHHSYYAEETKISRWDPTLVETDGYVN